MVGYFSREIDIQCHCIVQGFRVKEGLSCVLFRAVAAREYTQLSTSLTQKPCIQSLVGEYDGEKVHREERGEASRRQAVFFRFRVLQE